MAEGPWWHAPAFCHIERKFKDFLLCRCLEIHDLGEPAADVMLTDYFDVVLAPNPKLSDHQRQVVARDYEMRDDHVSISLRRATPYYFEKRLRWDVAEHLDKTQVTPVVVDKSEAFDAALVEATK